MSKRGKAEFSTMKPFSSDGQLSISPIVNVSQNEIFKTEDMNPARSLDVSLRALDDTVEVRPVIKELSDEIVEIRGFETVDKAPKLEPKGSAYRNSYRGGNRNKKPGTGMGKNKNPKSCKGFEDYNSGIATKGFGVETKGRFGQGLLKNALAPAARTGKLMNRKKERDALRRIMEFDKTAKIREVPDDIVIKKGMYAQYAQRIAGRSIVGGILGAALGGATGAITGALSDKERKEGALLGAQRGALLGGITSAVMPGISSVTGIASGLYGGYKARERIARAKVEQELAIEHEKKVQGLIKDYLNKKEYSSDIQIKELSDSVEVKGMNIGRQVKQGQMGRMGQFNQSAKPVDPKLSVRQPVQSKMNAIKHPLSTGPIKPMGTMKGVEDIQIKELSDGMVVEKFWKESVDIGRRALGRLNQPAFKKTLSTAQRRQNEVNALSAKHNVTSVNHNIHAAPKQPTKSVPRSNIGQKWDQLSQTGKRAVLGAGAVGAAGLTYGGYRAGKYLGQMENPPNLELDPRRAALDYAQRGYDDITEKSVSFGGLKKVLSYGSGAGIIPTATVAYGASELANRIQDRRNKKKKKK